ncbi:hypothetical protein, partial [Acetobacter sp.]|uniref:hypothetical protein n=1 Tax=Acetobacter sp. TaxID=440 RepID=UPI0039EAC0A4
IINSYAVRFGIQGLTGPSAERQKGLETATMAMPTFLCFCTADEPSSVENAVANYAKQPDYEDYVKKMQAFSRIYVPG